MEILQIFCCLLSISVFPCRGQSTQSDNYEQGFESISPSNQDNYRNSVLNHAPVSYSSILENYNTIGVELAKINVGTKTQFDSVLQEISNVTKTLEQLRHGPVKALEDAHQQRRADFVGLRKKLVQETKKVGIRLVANFRSAERERDILADALKDLAVELEEDKVKLDKELGSSLGTLGKILDKVEETVKSITSLGS